MTEVVFGPEKPPTSDWRWREVLDMEPQLVMKELKELDNNLFAARSELKESERGLADLEDKLYRSKQEALGSLTDPSLADSLFKGGTKDERAQRQETYLLSLEWVQQSEAAIKAARERKDNAQVAFDSLLDRQGNLHKWANMYSATAHLLSSIQVFDEDVLDEDVLAVISEHLDVLNKEARERLSEPDQYVVGGEVIPSDVATTVDKYGNEDLSL